MSEIISQTELIPGEHEIVPEADLTQEAVAAVLVGEVNGIVHIPLLYTRRMNGWKPKWRNAGGGVEPGETPEQALMREVKEETGMTIKRENILKRIHTATKTDAQGGAQPHLQHGYLVLLDNFEGFVGHALDGNEVLINKIFTARDIMDSIGHNTRLGEFFINRYHKEFLVAANMFAPEIFR